MIKRACITGASGFIGKHLISYLDKRKYEVYSLDHALLLDPPQLKYYLQTTKPEYIFHLAAYGNLNIHAKEEQKIFDANLTGLFNLLQASKDIPYEGFVNVSSSSVLLSYQTMYAATKAGGEHLCHAFRSLYNKPIVTLRPFSLYGENDHKSHLIPLLFNSCLKGHEMRIAYDPVHDYVYVGDFVERMAYYAAHAREKDIVHVGTGDTISNYWLCKEIEQITGKEAHITGTNEPRPYDNDEWAMRPHMGNCDYVKTTLTEGLQKVFKSYKLQ